MDSRLFPSLVVYEEMGTNARELGVGLIPRLGFEDLGFVDERSVIA